MEPLSYDELVQKQGHLDTRISQVKDFRTHKDLLKMARSCDNYRNDISKEMVECRRLRQETVKYQRLLQQYAESIATLEEYVTFALLLDH